MTTTAKQLKNHPQFTDSDFEYFIAKGWTLDEIKNRWDEEQSQRIHPVQHQPVFDLVGYLNK